MKRFLQLMSLTFCMLNVSMIQAQTITTICGNGTIGFSGDNGLALSAQISISNGQLASDNLGNIYIADSDNGRIRKINTSTGIITTIAGIGTTGFSGDGGPATAAQFNFGCGITLDNTGNIYICDFGNNRIRMINTSGIITTICGNGIGSSTGDGGPASAATINRPSNLCFDPFGNMYISEMYGHRIRKIATNGIISTYAGTGVGSNTGNGGLATAATIAYPSAITSDASGNIYFAPLQANSGGAQIRKITASTGSVNAYAGTGTAGYSGDGGSAVTASISEVGNMCFNAAGNLFFTDRVNYRIRSVSATGTISTYAGNGTQGFSGDGGIATAANIGNGSGILNINCSLYYIDGSARIRLVNSGPIPVVTVNSGAICNGNSFTIAPTGATSYIYQGGNSVVSPTANTNYTVIGTNTAGCASAPVTSSVSVNANPTVTAASNTSALCFGQSATLTANGANTYTWLPVGTGSIIAVSPTITSTYTVTGTDGNGCSNTNTLTQTVISCPTSISKNTVNSYFTIYPNPASDKVNIEFSNLENVKNIRIYNSIGQIVHTSKISEQNTTIDIKDLNTGIYFIEIKTQGNTLTRKLIKN